MGTMEKRERTRAGTEAMTKHVEYLDGWRGLAIACVLLSHFAYVPGLDIGRLGVDLFFVLSGLLMSRILYEQRTPLATFYFKRASRILPVFLLFLAAVYVFSLVRALPWSGGEIVASAFFLRTYLPADVGIWETAVPTGHLWSLNVEEHSYIILALVAAVPFVRGREGWPLLALAAVCAVMVLRYRSAGVPDYELRTECAALGLFLSAGYCRVKTMVDRFVKPWMPPLALGIGVACYAYAAHDLAKAIIAPACLAFAVNHIGSTYTSVIRILQTRALRMLGIWSYSLYLWQQPFYVFRDEFPPALAFAIAVIVGLCSFYMFEAPVRAWLNRLWLSSRAPAVTSPRRATGDDGYGGAAAEKMRMLVYARALRRTAARRGLGGGGGGIGLTSGAGGPAAGAGSPTRRPFLMRPDQRPASLMRRSSVGLSSSPFQAQTPGIKAGAGSSAKPPT